jgi:hypothetical protein
VNCKRFMLSISVSVGTSDIPCRQPWHTS